MHPKETPNNTFVIDDVFSVLWQKTYMNNFLMYGSFLIVYIGIALEHNVIQFF